MALIATLDLLFSAAFQYYVYAEICTIRHSDVDLLIRITAGQLVLSYAEMSGLCLSNRNYGAVKLDI